MSDFRDLRFTWRGFFKWTGATLLGVIMGALFALYFLDWNQMRGPIGALALPSHRPGDAHRRQPVGQTVHLAAQRRCRRRVSSATRTGSGTPQAARAKDFRIELRLVPLFWGHLVLPLVRIDEPDILVVRDADGRTNWDRGDAGPNQAYKLPPIQRFLVNDGHVKIDDAVRKLHFTGTVTSEENRGGGRSAFTLNGDGTLNTNKFMADVAGGPLLNVDDSKPYDFNADIHAGETHAVVKGADHPAVPSRPLHRAGGCQRADPVGSLLPDRPGAAVHARLSH